MNFFALQEQARKASRRMVVLFALAVVAIVVAVDLVLMAAGFGWDRMPGEPGIQLHYGALSAASLAVLAIIGFASLFRTLGLRSGGGSVARSLGATPVPADTSDPAWRRLRNIIEEVAIASGVPVPDIYVMEREDAINAFAAGYTPADAAICVTQGSLEQLSRDELQGVIAHEFSHILNGDMRLNIRLIGLLFGILIISTVGRIVMRSAGSTRSSDSRSGNGAYVVLIGLGLFVLGYIGYFFGRLIQAAVARSRESLADASAVQFTRQTTGLAGALKKIAALPAGSVLHAQETQQVAHMLFGEGLRSMALFATHPPLLQRIRALEPDFDPAELQRIAQSWARNSGTATTTAGGSEADDGDADAFWMPAAALAATGTVALPDASQRVAITPDGVTARVARPQQPDFVLAQGLHDNLPTDLLAATRDPEQAMQLVLALALMRAEASQLAREQLMAQTLGNSLARQRQVAHYVARVQTLHPMLRLPLAALSVPGLRRLSSEKRARMQDQLHDIAHADGRVGLPEYCLLKLVQTQVADAFDPRNRTHGRGMRLAQCAPEARDLLSLVARQGSTGDETVARTAFEVAQAELHLDQALEYACPQDWRPALDRALAKLDRISLRGKERLVRALTEAIRADGQVTVTEAELLRVVCAALHCPLPPLVQLPGNGDGSTP